MGTFVPPTYNQPINNRLGQHGVSFPVGKVVYICTDSEAHETTLIMGDFSSQVCSHGVGIATGSGDNGLALFRRGKTYTVTSGEETILTNAGYTVT